MNLSPPFPDVTNTEAARIERCLDKVGMSGIEVPVRMEVSGVGPTIASGRADAYVSLDKAEAKGIHMSRLFLALQKNFEKEAVSFSMIKNCLDDFIDSHPGLSNSSFVTVNFEIPAQRSSLLSKQLGWRSYQICMAGERHGDKYHFELQTMVQYSSTCPCSAALARQLIQKNFVEQFKNKDQFSTAEVVEWLGRETSIMATPHGQRSHAYITIVPETETSAPDIMTIIDVCERALGTPVQAAVKREDEQEFARLNGQNLMFAEDAARKLAAAVSSIEGIADFRVEARHLESLHAHDAVAITTKGVPNGLKPTQSWK